MKIKVGRQTLDLDTPKVMAIINVTPDSFYSESRTIFDEEIRRRVDDAVEQGASILDVGGYSSRPGAKDVTEEEELRRVAQAMEIIRKKYPDILVSIDTFRAGVVKACALEYGPFIVNDITAGKAEPDILTITAQYDLPYIAMHMRGTPQTMQALTKYRNIAADVEEYFRDKLEYLSANGIKQIILDPGFGFAKTVEQNYELLGQMHRLARFGLPVLAGISRKTMIYKPLGISPADALNGTSALHWECLRQGAAILRVHDTKEAAEVIKLYELFTSANA